MGAAPRPLAYHVRYKTGLVGAGAPDLPRTRDVRAAVNRILLYTSLAMHQCLRRQSYKWGAFEGSSMAMSHQLPTEDPTETARSRISEGAILTNEPVTEPDSAERDYRVVREVEADHYHGSEDRSDRVRYETVDGETAGFTDDAQIAYLVANGWVLQ